MRPFIARRLRGVLALIGVLPGFACADSTSTQLIGFASTSGPPRSIVTLQGEPLEDGKVVWDAGGENETVIPAGMGGTMFSVPLDATEGSHTVAVEDDSGRTAPITFFVDGDALQIPYPRIDHIMSLDAQFNGDGTVTTTLYVQGANFDVGSAVEINGTEVATVAQKAITNNLYGVPQDDLGYPIHHYVALAAVPAPMLAGTPLSVVVRNLDMKKSDAVTYKLPASEATMDSDGDSLLDAWETAGHDGNGDNVSDTDLYRRDIFVELDIMNGLTFPLVPTSASGPGTLDSIRAMFAAAPFLNPYTANGINLVLDVSGTVPAKDTVIFNTAGSAGNQAGNTLTVAFSTLKDQYFGHKADGDIYHYVIWAKRVLGGTSGRSDQPSPTSPVAPGDDAVIGLDDFPFSYRTARSQTEILAHELGHNLGQRHGGLNDQEFNPNYLSVMSYSWALRTGTNVVYRRDHQTCFPFYYAKAGEDEFNDQLPAAVNTVVDYSAGMAKEIIESSVNEVKGVCNQAVDWDGDDDVGEWTNRGADVNANRILNETLHDFANWRALQLDGPKKNGTIP